MKKSQLNQLCDLFNDSTDIPANEKWKNIKYIYTENALVDVQFLLSRGEILYIDDDEIDAGFYILDKPSANAGEVIDNTLLLTYIPVSFIDKVSFVTNYINTTNS